MSKISELAEKVDALRAEVVTLSAIAEEDLTDENIARMDALLPADENVVGELAAAEAELAPLVKRAEDLERVRKAAETPTNIERTAPAVHINRSEQAFENLLDLQYRSDRDPALRERALAAFDSKDLIQRGVTAEHRDAVLERIENVPGVARYALVHGSPVYRSAFEEYMRSNGNPAFTPEEAQIVRASMALGNSTGGYSLPTLLDPTLIHTGNATKNPIRAISRVVEGTVNVWHGVSVGNVTSYWTAEAGTTADGSPTFAGPTVTAAKMTSYVTGSYEIFEDSNLLSQLPGLINESQGFLEGTAFVSGSGTNAPRGIITAISATAGSTVTATTRGSFTTSSGVDVFALLNSVPSRYEDTVTWVANKATFNTIKQMPAGAGATSSIWPNYEAALGNPLLGSPTKQASDFSSATTSGTVLIVLGDFSQYVIYDRIGTQVEFMQNVVDQATGLPTGQRGLVAHRRVGGDVTDVNAFRFLKC